MPYLFDIIQQERIWWEKALVCEVMIFNSCKCLDRTKKIYMNHNKTTKSVISTDHIHEEKQQHKHHRMCAQYMAISTNWKAMAQCIHIGGTGFCHIGISIKKWRSYSASSPHLSKAINSGSIVELVITVYLEDFQATTAPASVNTYPLVDFESFISNIQFASLYPTVTGHRCTGPTKDATNSSMHEG